MKTVLLFLLALPMQLMAGAKSDHIFSKLQSLTQMREGLASTLSDKAAITEDTFKAVCQPVGIELKKWSEAEGFRSLQISHKNRNAKNLIPENLRAAYGEFLGNIVFVPN